MSNSQKTLIAVFFFVSLNIFSQTTVDGILRKSESFSSLDESISFLEKKLEEKNNDSEKKDIWLHLGYYKEIAGDILSAQYYYQLAAENSADPYSQKSYLDSAILDQYLGQYNDSEIQLKKILNGTQNHSILAIASIFLSRKYLITGEEAFPSSLKKLKPYSDFPLTAYYLNLAGVKSYKDFPGGNTPEKMLFMKKIKLLPNVENVFGLLNTVSDDATNNSIVTHQNIDDQSHHYYIQAGSFKDPENAEYLSRDLKKLGFKAFVNKQEVTGTIYYKVLLDAEEQGNVQKLIIKLKDNGYEGYPVY